MKKYVYSYNDVYFIFLYYSLLFKKSVKSGELYDFVDYLTENGKFVVSTDDVCPRSSTEFAKNYRSFFTYDTVSDEISLNINDEINTLNKAAVIMELFDGEVSNKIKLYKDELIKNNKENYAKKLEEQIKCMNSDVVAELLNFCSSYNNEKKVRDGLVKKLVKQMKMS